MDAEERSLQASVCAAPEDDTPRLVYADWMGENGHPEREEFIRVQVERAGWLGRLALKKEDQERLLVLHRRERALLDGPAGGGFRHHALWYDVPCGTPTYTRGFVTSVTCTAADWNAHADSLVWPATVKCPGCYIGGATSAPNGYAVRIEHQVWGSYSRTEEYPKKPLCRLCRGERRVPNPIPCPPTAQPITEVRLTTHPESSITAVERQRKWIVPPRLGGGYLDSWKAEWPWITFTVPQERRRYRFRIGDPVYSDADGRAVPAGGGAPLGRVVGSRPSGGRVRVLLELPRGRPVVEVEVGFVPGGPE